MNITIIRPAHAHSAYKIAADTFAELSKTVGNANVNETVDEEFTTPKDELTVLIGNDAVNTCVADLYLSLKINAFGIRYGTDDYCIRCAEIDGKRYLFLAGGRPRAAIYAVYRYFEIFCGCRWFWDGDRIKKSSLPLYDFDILESPRFDYRGLRYFAHRSLHRFQAEHWSFEDWKFEIDWILKKRLNIFMLRIGTDDVFQKAFPEIVPYPNRDEPLRGAGEGYDDRTLFWSLQYRGELRKKILQYSFERDLWHPEDCGTMTHWYSRTPIEFMEKENPVLLPQTNRHYNDPTGRVWDVRIKKNFDNYIKLTETHVKEYGKPEIFHTIGLGERRYSDDRETNKRMKLFVYRKIATQIQEKYPNAPLLIASWDLWMQFTSDEVRDLVAELNPAQSIIFDYTSETLRKNNFTQWGIINKFPWVFGLFSGYEANSEIRGAYDVAHERLAMAKADNMCKGFILWSELSHGDTFMIEYFASNAWESETLSISEQIDKFCTDRYPEGVSVKMANIWHKFMPIVQLTNWSTTDPIHMHGYDIFPYMLEKTEFKFEYAEHYKNKVEPFVPYKEIAIEILEALANIPLDDEMVKRDAYDIARTVIGRYLNAAIFKTEALFTAGATASVLESTMNLALALMEYITEILGSHEDFSMLSSLKRLESVTETNPNFESTLKNNASCTYCRSYIYENAEYLYLPEMKLVFDEVKRVANTGEKYDKTEISTEVEAIRKCYAETPLAKMKRDCIPFSEAIVCAANKIKNLNL